MVTFQKYTYTCAQIYAAGINKGKIIKKQNWKRQKCPYGRTRVKYISEK